MISTSIKCLNIFISFYAGLNDNCLVLGETDEFFFMRIQLR